MPDYRSMSEVELSRHITEDEAKNETVLAGRSPEDRDYVYFLYHVKNMHRINYHDPSATEGDKLAARERLQEIASMVGLSILDALSELGLEDPQGLFF